MFKTKAGSSFRYGLVFALALVFVAWWALKTDSNRLEIEKYLSENKQVIEAAGSIEELDLRKVTYVDESMDYAGKHSLGYSLYNYRVQGSEAELLAVVKLMESPMSETSVLMLDKLHVYK